MLLTTVAALIHSSLLAIRSADGYDVCAEQVQQGTTVLQQTCTNLPLTIPPLAARSEHGCLHDRVQLRHQRPTAA